MTIIKKKRYPVQENLIIEGSLEHYVDFKEYSSLSQMIHLDIK